MAPTEETALETLRLFLSRRGLPTDTERITPDDIEKANLYTIGKMLVIFNQKQTTSIADISNYRKFAAENAYAQGLVIDIPFQAIRQCIAYDEGGCQGPRTFLLPTRAAIRHHAVSLVHAAPYSEAR
jgi:hypothetical protein